MPHKKRNGSSCHMTEKAAIEFKARRGECRRTESSAASEGHRLALCSLKKRQDRCFHTLEDISTSKRYQLSFQFFGVIKFPV